MGPLKFLKAGGGNSELGSLLDFEPLKVVVVSDAKRRFDYNVYKLTA